MSRPTITSRLINQAWLFLPTCPRAMPRTRTVSVWVPAMPPMEATMGISTASATTFSMVPWNRLMTPAAMKAVIRLMPSHMARRGAVRNTGAKVSSSSSRPAMDMNE